MYTLDAVITVVDAKNILTRLAEEKPEVRAVYVDMIPYFESYCTILKNTNTYLTICISDHLNRELRMNQVSSISMHSTK